LTLTYAPSQVWERRDITRFIDALRKFYARRGWQFVYFWVAELQQRGAVHYHVIVFVPKGHKIPKPDRWWKKGFTHIFAVRHFAAYLSKYLQKFPSPQGGSETRNGIRLHPIKMSFHPLKAGRRLRENGGKGGQKKAKGREGCRRPSVGGKS
jgi:hypothetical protein